jgi:AraC-like DNA-binding protein
MKLHAESLAIMQDYDTYGKRSGYGTGAAGFRPEYQDEDIILFDDSSRFFNRQAIRTDFNFFVLCYGGSLSVTVNNIPLKLNPYTLLRCPTGAVVSDAVSSEDFKYFALAITNRALQSYLKDNIHIWNQLIYKYKMFTMEIGESDFAILQKFHELLLCSLETGLVNGNPRFRGSLIKGLVETELNAFCFKIDVDEAAVEAAADKEPSPHSFDLFNKFLNLLQQREVKLRTVDQFASELCISPKYLTFICKKHSGKTAKKWIEEYTVSDIAYYLSSTNLSIKEICYRTGFRNCSFFCKYVKEHLHYSPIAYRLKSKA